MNLGFEGLQILRYQEGDKFDKHIDSDYNGMERLYTTLIYLNDDYEGGETNFPINGTKIIPKKGKLIIWKNKKNGVDYDKSMHESLPVIKGTKYALVNWVLIK